MERAFAVRPTTLVTLSMLAAVLAVACSDGAVPLRPISTIFCADGKKVVHSGDEQLLFYDGLEESARVLAQIDCKGQAVTASTQGKFVALCSQFIGTGGPVRIFDNQGKQVGEFEVGAPWKVTALSDSGRMIALGKALPGASPLVVRLCDLEGKVLRDYGEVTRIRFASGGAPVVWGAPVTTRRAFISVLDDRGDDIAGYLYRDEGIWIHDVAISAKASVIALVPGPRSANFPDRVTIWATAGDTRPTVVVDKDLGEFQPDPSMSPHGVYMALRLGATGIAVIRCADATVHLKKDLAPLLGATEQTAHVLGVTVYDDASFTIRYQPPGGADTRAVAWAEFDREGRFVSKSRLPATTR